jgi:DNA-directed RNA polymerase subunit RPC12/RpoP
MHAMPETKKLQIRCSGCQALLKVSSEALGKIIACPKCGKKMQLAKPSPASSLSEPEPANHVAIQDDLFDLPSASYSMPIPASSSKKLTEVKASSTPWAWIVAIASAGALALVLIPVGIIFLSPMSQGPNVIDSTPEKSPSTLGVSPSGTAPSNAVVQGLTSSEFPQLGQPNTFGNTGIVWHRIELRRQARTALKLNVFIPKGTHADKSLPVVFEAPAGTPLLHGASIVYPQPDTEFLPFTEAGMITVSFDIDGPMSNRVSPADGAMYMRLLSKAYPDFVDSDAGVDNGKLAIDFVLARLPMADPKRLITWGHSSAATLSLLLASKDPRISRCIALAPVTDLKPRFGDILVQEPAMAKILPGLETYIGTGSPITYVTKLRCPVFIAHAKNDDNEPFSGTKVYVEALRKAGGKVDFLELEREGHYEPLLKAAVPKALEWLN